MNVTNPFLLISVFRAKRPWNKWNFQHHLFLLAALDTMPRAEPHSPKCQRSITEDRYSPHSILGWISFSFSFFFFLLTTSRPLYPEIFTRLIKDPNNQAFFHLCIQELDMAPASQSTLPVVLSSAQKQDVVPGIIPIRSKI